jgi:hypothetical protein
MQTMIEVSRDVAKEMLPCLESKLENAEGELAILEENVARLKQSIAELRAKLNGGDLPLADGQSLRKRLPKGYGAEAILTLLKSLPEKQGLRMSEISKRSGVNHVTVYRTLRDPKRNKGRFVQEGNEWKIKR